MTNHVALWSHSQKAFHVESVDDMLDANIVAFAQKRAVDYVPVFMGTESDCRAAVTKLMEKL